MNPRDVHPLCHLWPHWAENEIPRDLSPSLAIETRREHARRLRNKRKKWRQKRRGRK